MKITSQKWHVRAGILFGTVLFSLLFLVSSGAANEDIFSMARRGDIDGVREIITKLESVDIRNDNQETLLHVAAWYGFAEIVELLVNASADVNARTYRGWTPLHHALRLPRNEALRADLLEEKTQIIEFLISNGANVNAQENTGATPLMIFALASSLAQDNTQFISQILEIFSRSDVNLNARSSIGITALSFAASRSNESVLVWLIQNNADVNLKDSNGMTPLHAAAIEANGEIIQILIDAGADVHAIGNNGANALWYAAVGGNLDAFLILLEHDSEVNIFTYGLTTLHAATGYGAIHIFSENGFRKNRGRTFHETIERQRIPRENFLLIIKALVEAGADVYALYPTTEQAWFLRSRNRTAYDLAIEIGNREVADYLRSVMRRTGWRNWLWPF